MDYQYAKKVINGVLTSKYVREHLSFDSRAIVKQAWEVVRKSVLKDKHNTPTPVHMAIEGLTLGIDDLKEYQGFDQIVSDMENIRSKLQQETATNVAKK